MALKKIIKIINHLQENSAQEHWRNIENMLKTGTFKEPMRIMYYPCHVPRFWKYRDHFIKETQFTPETKNSTKLRLLKSIEQWKKQNDLPTESPDPTIITVHVRRKDYIQYLKWRGEGSVPDISYFKAAFKHYTERLVSVMDFRWVNHWLPVLSYKFGKVI